MTTTLQQIETPPQAGAPTRTNENFQAVSPAAIFAMDPETTTGLIWGFKGGYFNGNDIAGGTVTMTDAATNYVVVLRSTGVVSVSTSSTNSLNPLYAKLYTNVCAGGVVTNEGANDRRWDANGLFMGGAPSSVDAADVSISDSNSHYVGMTVEEALEEIAASLAAKQPLDSDLTTIAGLTATTDNFLQAKSSAWASRTPAQVTADLQGTGLVTDAVGFRYIPSNSQSTAYTTVAADNGKSIDHPSTDANARTFTIDSNANVAYPVGTTISFSNMTSQVVTIAITSDTMYLAGTGTTGSRSLAQYGTATARKLTSTTWLISGVGLT